MHETFEASLFWLAVALTLYSVFSAIAAKLKQPKVLGGLVAGFLLAVVTTAIPGLKPDQHGFISRLTELGAMLLLFFAGLEANLHSVLRDAKIGWKVATVGVLVPMFGAFAYLMAAKDVAWPVALFQGGVFAATSVGITAAVLTELGVMNREYSRIIISAAVIDDIMGLVVLAICQACNAPGPVSVSSIAWQVSVALVFVVAVPVAGHLSARRIINGLYRLSPESQEAIILAWLVLYGAAAIKFGLAPIVGAYFAGVAIEEAYFNENPGEPNPHHKPVEHYIKGLVGGFGPVFFVYAGSVVDPRVFLNPGVLFTGLVFTAIAVAGKLASGLVATPGNKLIVGVGMAPRGEVGIIFAAMGLQSGILNQELFGASMIMVMFTTLVTPPLLGRCIAAAPPQAQPLPPSSADGARAANAALPPPAPAVADAAVENT